MGPSLRLTCLCLALACAAPMLAADPSRATAADATLTPQRVFELLHQAGLPSGRGATFYATDEWLKDHGWEPPIPGWYGGGTLRLGETCFVLAPDTQGRRLMVSDFILSVSELAPTADPRRLELGHDGYYLVAPPERSHPVSPEVGARGWIELLDAHERESIQSTRQETSRPPRRGISPLNISALGAAALFDEMGLHAEAASLCEKAMRNSGSPKDALQQALHILASGTCDRAGRQLAVDGDLELYAARTRPLAALAAEFPDDTFPIPTGALPSGDRPRDRPKAKAGPKLSSEDQRLASRLSTEPSNPPPFYLSLFGSKGHEFDMPFWLIPSPRLVRLTRRGSVIDDILARGSASIPLLMSLLDDDERTRLATTVERDAGGYARWLSSRSAPFSHGPFTRGDVAHSLLLLLARQRTLSTQDVVTAEDLPTTVMPFRGETPRTIALTCLAGGGLDLRRRAIAYLARHGDRQSDALVAGSLVGQSDLGGALALARVWTWIRGTPPAGFVQAQTARLQELLAPGARQLHRLTSNADFVEQARGALLVLAKPRPVETLVREADATPDPYHRRVLLSEVAGRAAGSSPGETAARLIRAALAARTVAVRRRLIELATQAETPPVAGRPALRHPRLWASLLDDRRPAFPSAAFDGPLARLDDTGRRLDMRELSVGEMVAAWIEARFGPVAGPRLDLRRIAAYPKLRSLLVERARRRLARPSSLLPPFALTPEATERAHHDPGPHPADAAWRVADVTFLPSPALPASLKVSWWRSLTGQRLGPEAVDRATRLCRDEADRGRWLLVEFRRLPDLSGVHITVDARQPDPELPENTLPDSGEGPRVTAHITSLDGTVATGSQKYVGGFERASDGTVTFDHDSTPRWYPIDPRHESRYSAQSSFAAALRARLLEDRQPLAPVTVLVGGMPAKTGQEQFSDSSSIERELHPEVSSADEQDVIELPDI